MIDIGEFFYGFTCWAFLI